MVRVMRKQEPYTNNDIKSNLAIDTYNIYQNSRLSCIHRNRNDNQSPFVDWYLILRVGEDASIDIVRKQYRKFALLLHPDKNKHPKAEFAFKLISQAYECLSDEARRSYFKLERWKNMCTKCNKSPRSVISSPTRPTHTSKTAKGSPTTAGNSRSCNTQQHVRGINEQIKEEARVIEGCIKVNQGPKTDYPVFEPSNYAHLGYPHRRNRYVFDKKAAGFWGVQNRNGILDFDPRRGRCESPIFELKKDCRNININSACVGS